MTTSNDHSSEASISVDIRREIDLPAEAVWSVLADYRNDPLWRRGVSWMESSPRGPVTAGMTTVEEMRLAGRGYRNLGVVTEVDPGVRFAWRTTDGAQANGARSVEVHSDVSCVVRLELHVRVAGAQRLASPLLGMMLRRNLTGDLKRLHLLVMSSAVGNRASAADEIGGGSSARI